MKKNRHPVEGCILLAARFKQHQPIHKQLFPEQLKIGIVAPVNPVTRLQQLVS